MLSLKKYGLHSEEKVRATLSRLSVSEIRALIGTKLLVESLGIVINQRTNPATPNRFENHNLCIDFEFQYEAEVIILTEVDCPVLESHSRHMEAARVALGGKSMGDHPELKQNLY